MGQILPDAKAPILPSHLPLKREAKPEFGTQTVHPRWCEMVLLPNDPSDPKAAKGDLRRVQYRKVLCHEGGCLAFMPESKPFALARTLTVQDFVLGTGHSLYRGQVALDTATLHAQTLAVDLAAGSQISGNFRTNHQGTLLPTSPTLADRFSLARKAGLDRLQKHTLHLDVYMISLLA